ncbi:MAG TPA: cation:proton antiporter [Gammaproteobacteria bacterium]|nr:cation:proton antiporter [Gammaproteobacteria bacterium]
MTPTITHVIFLIFAGTAALSTLALFTRQSLLVAYIALGAIVGPHALGLVSNSDVIKQSGDIGIIFLLFLLGLHLQPQSLLHSLRKMSWITLASALVFFAFGFVLTRLFGFTNDEALVVGIAAMFSSTIIGLKLLPTTILHHQHTGELVVSILLLQDIIAIFVLFILELLANRSATVLHLLTILSAFPTLLIVAYVFQHFVLSKLMRRFDKIHEYLFILSIGWCLCMAELSHVFGLSEEIGAFMAGVALASSPIAFYIAENLKPLRDFFLVIFFFSVGASFDFGEFTQVAIPAFAIGGFMLLLKPLVFNWLLRRSGEVRKISREIGVRLGQLSEFSLLVIYMALDTQQISSLAASMAQGAVIITFIVSCYWTAMRYPTPLAANDRLRRD